jgi:hypothetical protein
LCFLHILYTFRKALVIFIKPPPPAQWIYCSSFHLQLFQDKGKSLRLSHGLKLKALGRGHYQHLGCAQLHLAWALYSGNGLVLELGALP